MPTVCFFAKVKSRDDLKTIEFYAQDIQILTDLGYDVKLAINPWELTIADLFFSWWWTWSFIPVTFAKLVKRPVIITGTFNCYSFNSRPMYQQKLIEYSVNNANCNIPVSQLEYNQLISMFPKAKLVYSPHVVDNNTYCPGDDDRENYVYTTAAMVVGNAERKCIPELIKAAVLVHESIKDVKFIFAGKCDQKYRELVHTLNASSYINLPGEISANKKINYLQKCSVYVQPSRYEGFGLAVLEALSCGAPVLTSPVGAIPEVVGGAAVLVDGSSPKDIANGIIKMLNNSKFRKEMGDAGLTRARSLFGFDRRKNDIKKIIDSLC